MTAGAQPAMLISKRPSGSQRERTSVGQSGSIAFLR